MNPGMIYIYAGKIEEWTEKWKEEKHRESICGRLLLIRGLQDLGWGEFFGSLKDPQSLLDVLESRIKKETWGKPYLVCSPQVYFNISHSGGYGVCAISSQPCGVDIQEIRPVKSRRMISRTMNQEEQKQILKAEDSIREFIKLWTYKESCIKLSGEGLQRELKNLPAPGCHRFFWLKEDLAGCVASTDSFNLEIRRPKPRKIS